jgi:hypothetical protein
MIDARLSARIVADWVISGFGFPHRGEQGFVVSYRAGLTCK